MKTSNIILGIIAGSFTFIILAGAIQLRLTGVTNETKRSIETEASAQTLEPFRYLIVREATNFTVSPATRNRLTVFKGQDDPDPVIEYAQRGDTLFINRIAHGEKGRTLRVNLEVEAGVISYIGAMNSRFHVAGFPSERLAVDLRSARLYLSANDSLSISQLRLTASENSDFHMENQMIDTLDIQLDHSSATLDEVNKVRAILRNESTLNLNDALDVEYRKDQSSEVH